MSDGDRGRSGQSEPPRPAELRGEAAEDPEPGAPPALELEIGIESDDWSVVPDAEALIRTAAAALAAHPLARELRGRAASIVLADDARVRGLNAAYRGKDAPTNVLSFPFEPAPGTPLPEEDLYLGDIILAVETVLREADELEIPPSHHLQHLIVHGLLHLLGFDHIEDAEAEEMEGIEIRVLAGLGIADPYAA